MKDAVLAEYYKNNPPETIRNKYNLNYNGVYCFYFLTLHRQENTDDIIRFIKIIKMLKRSQI